MLDAHLCLVLYPWALTDNWQTAVRRRMVYVDKHVLLHRLCVGMDMNFGSNAVLHSLMASYLPETRAALRGRAALDPTGMMAAASSISVVGVNLYDAWVGLMSAARRAAADAAGMNVPAFGQRSAYRL